MNKKNVFSPGRRSRFIVALGWQTIIVALALFFVVQDRPLAAHAPISLPAELTLLQALDLALTNNNLLRAAQADFDQAIGRYEQSRSHLLPQVGVTARQGVQTVNLQGF